MERAVITGATGFFGRHLTQRLLDDGFEVTAVVRAGHESDFADNGNLRVIVSDLSEIDTALAGCGDFDVFFHFGWDKVNRIGIDDFETQWENINNSILCLHAAAKHNCRTFLDAGTRFEYGRIDGKYTEQSEAAPIVAFGKAKLKFYKTACEYCCGSPMQYIHPRIFTVYGPDDHPFTLVYSTLKRLLAGQSMPLSDCNHLWNYLYIDDLIDALMLLYGCRAKIPAADSGIFNIASLDTRRLRSFCEQLFELSGGRGSLSYGEYTLGSEGAVSLDPDISKLRALTGWTPRFTFEQGIRAMLLEWQRES